MTGLNITSAGCHREQLATAAPRAGLALTHLKEAEEQDISGDWRDFRAGQRDTQVVTAWEERGDGAGHSGGARKGKKPSSNNLKKPLPCLGAPEHPCLQSSGRVGKISPP